MTEIFRNQVIHVAPEHLSISGMQRVLWIDPGADRLVTISVDQKKRSGPTHVSFSALQAALVAGYATVAEVRPDPRSLMSDAQLTLAYPPRDETNISFPLAYRTFWWSVIEPIVDECERVFKGQFTLNALVTTRAKETSTSRQRIYQILYLFWASGSTIASVLPLTHRCGGRGKRRAGRMLVLGRRSLKTALQGKPLDTYPLSEKDIDQLKYGWRAYLKKNVSIREAYLQAMRTFYSTCWEQQGEATKAVLKPPGERPSLRQFYYHGADDDPGLRAWQLLLGPREYLLNHRPLDGLPNDGLRHIGAVGQADASTNDVHLVSLFDRLRNVGTCHFLLIVDEATTLIVGFCVAWSIDAEAVKLAILNAASSKVDLCARYGITITDEEWPRAVFAKLLVDRGEFNCLAVFDACRALNSSLELVQVGRGDSKGQVEGKHHSLHAALSHKLPGTTHGRMRERGESEPALDACLNIHEYTTELIRAIIHHNTQMPVPHLLTTEMQQDGVAPTRIAIWNWCKRRGYVAYSNCEPDRVITTLCPVIDAVITGDGVYLIVRRPPPAADKVIIKKLRYLGEIARILNWLEEARRRGRLHISVFHNPNDLRRIWYLDPELGLQPLDLLTNDPLLAEATLHDVILAEMFEVLETQAQAEVAMLSQSDMALERETTVQNARAEKARAQAASDQPVSKRERLKNRKQNRAQEIAQTGKTHLPTTVSLMSETPTHNVSATDVDGSNQHSQLLSDIERWLAEGELS